MGDIHPLQSVFLALDEETLDLSIQPMPDLLQQNMHIGDVARVLSYGGNGIEDLRDVREVEVSTDRERLRTPVTTAYHRVHIGQAALARGAVAEVPHETGACEGKVALGIGYVAEAIGRCMGELGMDGIEDLLYGGGAFGTLTEEVFVTGLTLELDDS